MTRTYFGIAASGVDPVRLEERFSKMLVRHQIPQPDTISTLLFTGLRHGTNQVPAPFPLVTSARLANSHAKQLHKVLRGYWSDASLNRAMNLFAEYWGYSSWAAFKYAAEAYTTLRKDAPSAGPE